MGEAPKLKDYLTAELVTEMGGRVRSVHKPFDGARFVELAMAEGWDELTFTARTQRIADALWTVLDLGPEPALAVLEAILPEELDDPEGALNEGFWLWPLGDLIATYTVDHPEPSYRAIEVLTKRFTGEFAIRPFLDRYPEALDQIDRWARDPNEHVRRLASEGTRPRLPWASRLELPIDRILDVLTTLRRDESLYVRRSVANHLNDLAKDNNERIVSMLEDWHREDVAETSWIVRHAMRNHLKNGDPRVLAMFGYQQADVEIRDLRPDRSSVAIGETVSISFELSGRGDKSQKLMVDLVVGYMKANGTANPKVFKFKDFELEPGSTETCSKKLDMIVRSTRKLYPGLHTVTVRVNGSDLASTGFELTE